MRGSDRPERRESIRWHRTGCTADVALAPRFFASPDLMNRTTARTLLGATWPPPAWPSQPTENHTESAIGR